MAIISIFSRRAPALAAALLAGTTVVSLSACSLDKLVGVKDPEVGQQLTQDAVQSRAGGVGLFNSSMARLQQGVSALNLDVAEFTDELTLLSPNDFDYFDAFVPTEDFDLRMERLDALGQRRLVSQSYHKLQEARVAATQARSVLRALNDTSLAPLIAASYAVEGFSIVLLAETQCSGIPLTRTDYGGTIVYGEGLSTAELLQAAIARFDSSLAITHDSARFTTLARVGKGRAYLGLGQYALAAQAVASVAPADQFTLTFTDAETPGSTQSDYFYWLSLFNGRVLLGTEIVNHEGNNGIVWFTDPAQIDPRVPVTTDGPTAFTFAVRTMKYVDPSPTVALARWIDAKMIRAEYDLSVGDVQWLTELNDARRTVGLADTTDPGNALARVDLLFRERAYWFYGEGARLGDFRRLVRQYNRPAAQVYPGGAYTRSIFGIQFYGDALVFSPPPEEVANNYRYQGCINKEP